MVPKISIIVVNYNGEKWIRKCFHTIAGQDYPKDRIQIILVDNNSSDNSRSYVKAAYPSVIIVNSGYNAGYSGGVNFGYKHADGDYVAMMANDMLFPKNWIKKMIEPLENNNDVAVATATMVNGEDTSGSDGELLNATPVLVGRGDSKKSGYTVVPWGGACVFRKRLFDGPFDADYFIYGEDVYMGLLSWLMKYKVMENGIKVAHMGSVTIGFNSWSQVYYNERNRLINLLSFFKWKTIFMLRPLIAIDFAFKTLYFLKINRPDLVRAELGSVFWCIRNFNKILEKRRHIQGKRRVQDNVILGVLCENLYGTGRLKDMLNVPSIGYFRFIKRVCRAFGI